MSERDEYPAGVPCWVATISPEPERAAGRRRYGPEVLRRLAIIAASQRVGFALTTRKH